MAGESDDMAQLLELKMEAFHLMVRVASRCPEGVAFLEQAMAAVRQAADQMQAGELAAEPRIRLG